MTGGKTSSQATGGRKAESLERELRRGVLDLIVLRVLADGPTYGYQLVTEVAERSEGELELHEGTLYPLLYRLEEQGLVRTEWDTPDRGAPRKYYRLTAPGRKRLEELRREWRRFSRRIDALLGPSGGTDREGEST